MDLTSERLLADGFSRVGSWCLADTAGGARLDGQAPKQGGVYVHAVDGIGRYVGSARSGLGRRLRHYQTTTRLRTAYRVRTAILDRLRAGQCVETFAIVTPLEPTTWNGMPIDVLLGLEEGLIRQYRPDWNRRGLGAATRDTLEEMA